MERQRNELPIDFSVRNFKPGNARRRAEVGPGHAAGIEKQDATASLVARDVGVAMQENIHIIRRMIRRNVLQSKFQPAADKIDDQRPFKIAVAISPHERDAWPDGPQLVKNRVRANVPKMPGFIGVFSHFLHAFRQTIVRVGKNENAQSVFRLFQHAPVEIWMAGS